MTHNLPPHDCPDPDGEHRLSVAGLACQTSGYYFPTAYRHSERTGFRAVQNPEQLLGNLFFPFVSMSVAIILFEGSLTLNFREISGLQSVVRNMVSFGMLVTWVITAVAARYAIGLSWSIALVFGAITVVSGPTVIAPPDAHRQTDGSSRQHPPLGRHCYRSDWSVPGGSDLRISYFRGWTERYRSYSDYDW